MICRVIAWQSNQVTDRHSYHRKSSHCFIWCGWVRVLLVGWEQTTEFKLSYRTYKHRRRLRIMSMNFLIAQLSCPNIDVVQNCIDLLIWMIITITLFSSVCACHESCPHTTVNNIHVNIVKKFGMNLINGNIKKALIINSTKYIYTCTYLMLSEL